MAEKFTVSTAVLDWVIGQMSAQAANPKYLEEVKSWKEQTKSPTFSRLEAVSSHIHIPIGYFFLDTPPEEDIPLLKFRTVANATSDNPSRELIDTINSMENIVDWMRENLRAEGFEPNQFAGKMKGENNPQALAAFIREILEIDTDWFRHAANAAESFKTLREKISNCGIIVMMNGIVGSNTHRNLELNEFRAFTIMDDYAPLIFINGKDSDNGRLFSLLHEFAHVCLGIDNLFNAEYGSGVIFDATEQLCNAAAAEVLVPKKLFLQEWKELSGDIERLAAYFRCSTIVIARRALDADYISQDEYNQIEQEAIENYLASRHSSSDGGNFYSTQRTRLDARFFHLLLDSIAQGRTQYTEAFRLTSMSRKTFEHFAGESL